LRTGKARAGILAPVAQGAWQQGIGNVNEQNVIQGGLTGRNTANLASAEKKQGPALEAAKYEADQRRLGEIGRGSGAAEVEGRNQLALEAVRGPREERIHTAANTAAADLEKAKGRTALEISAGSALAPALTERKIDPSMLPAARSSLYPGLTPPTAAGAGSTSPSIFPSILPGKMGEAMRKAPTGDIEDFQKAQSSKDLDEIIRIAQRNEVPDDVIENYLQTINPRSMLRTTVNNPHGYLGGGGWIPFLPSNY
jgi:hypothetical protein